MNSLCRLSRGAALGCGAFLLLGAGSPAAAQFPAQPASVQLLLSTPAPDTLLALVRQANQVPNSPRYLHERLRHQLLNEAGDRVVLGFEHDLWADLAGQRFQLEESSEQRLNNRFVVGPDGAVLFTPQGGTVPLPRRDAAQMQAALRGGIVALALADSAGYRVRSLGEQTWAQGQPLGLRGPVLEISWKAGKVQYLLDPQSYRVLAERGGTEEDLHYVTYYGDVRGGGATGLAQAQVLTYLRESDDGLKVHGRAEVLERRFLPDLPVGAFEVSK